MPPVGVRNRPLEDADIAAFALSQSTKHQRGAIVKLQSEPIPANNPFAERARPKLVIHPTHPRNIMFFSTADNCTLCIQPYEAVVVIRVPALGPLLTQPLPPVQQRRACFSQVQIDCDTRFNLVVDSL